MKPNTSSKEAQTKTQLNKELQITAKATQAKRIPKHKCVLTEMGQPSQEIYKVNNSLFNNTGNKSKMAKINSWCSSH